MCGLSPRRDGRRVRRLVRGCGAVSAALRPANSSYAIVPANQQRIGESLGRFITNNFLTRKTISRQLAEIDIAGSVARWLGDPVNARKLAAYGGRFLPEILKKVPRLRLGEFVGSLSGVAWTLSQRHFSPHAV